MKVDCEKFSVIDSTCSEQVQNRFCGVGSREDSSYERPIVVSVVVPVYNVEAYLRTSLNSVLSQTLDKIEVICVDDGSTDASISILNEYATRDKRIIILHQENQGAGVARNRALDIARGEWIAFLDPDDCYPSQETLERLVSTAKQNFVDICGGSLRTINTDGEVVQKMHSGDNAGYLFQSDGLREYRSYQFEYGYWRFIYRRSFLDRNKLRFPAVRRFQDPPFMVAAFTAAGRFYSLQEDTYCYREGQGFKNVDWKADNFLKAKHYLQGLHQVLSIAIAEGYDELLARTYRRMFKGGGKFLWTDEYFPYLKPEISAILDDFIPRVSIVIPVYNVEKFVGETLDSVLQQTYPNLEIICVNDGSTDGSLSVVQNYSSQFNGIKTLRILSQKNGGLSAARNTGMDSATGKYVYFLDSDDKIYPYAISELVGLAEKEELDQVIFSSDVFVDGDDVDLAKQKEGFKTYYEIPLTACGRVMSGSAMFETLTSLNKFHCSQPLRFYRRSVLEDHKCRFPVGLLHEDNYFAPLSLKFANRVMAVNKRFYQRRVRANSIMTATGDITPRFRGMLGVCLALIRNEVLWTKDVAYLSGLRKHIFNLSRAIGWHCRSEKEIYWDKVVEGFVSSEEKRIWIEFIFPILRDRASEIVRANNNTRFYKQAQTSLESLENKYEQSQNELKRALESLKVKHNQFITKVQQESDVQQKIEHLIKCQKESESFQRLMEKYLLTARSEIKALHNSEAYRIGMFVTWPARKVYGGIKCLRENGVKYTIKHIFRKFLRLISVKVK